MSLDNFGHFKTALADLAWGEITTAQVGDFFTQAQSKMYRGHGDGSDGLARIKPLRCAAMISSGTLTPSATGTVTISSAVSAAFLGFKEITPTAVYSRSLDYLDYWEFRKRADLAVAGPATVYSIEGDTLYTGPYSTATLSAIWYQKFTALSLDADTDWVLTNAPQIYLDGCMADICAYLQDDREGAFRSKFAAGINAINLNDTVTKMSGAVKRSMPRSVA